MTCQLINKVPGTLTANRPLRTYADKEMGLTWLKARIYCFGEVILVQDLDYLSVSIYFMNDPICGESNYWTQKLNQRFLPYSISGQCSYFMVLETPENMFCFLAGSMKREQWPLIHFKAFIFCALNIDSSSISE